MKNIFVIYIDTENDKEQMCCYSWAAILLHDVCFLFDGNTHLDEH